MTCMGRISNGAGIIAATILQITSNKYAYANELTEEAKEQPLLACRCGLNLDG